MSSNSNHHGHGSGPSATSTVLRRFQDGTPPKMNSNLTAAAAHPIGSSSSPKKAIVVNGCELPPGVPDMSKLTVEQRLNLFQNLMKKEYKAGAGMSQFLPMSSSSSSGSVSNNSGKEPTVRNLNQAFDDDTSTLSVIKGNNRRRFVETLTTDNNGDLGDDSPEVLDDEAREEDDDTDDTLRSDGSQEEMKGKNDNLPEICRLVDEYVTIHDQYKILLERANEAVVEKNFAAAFPEDRVVSLFREIDGFMTSLEAFNLQSPAENMKIFYSNESSQKRSSKKTINCPVQQQEELLATVYKLSGILRKLNKQMNSDQWKNMEETLGEKMQLYRKTVDKMERDLKDLDKKQKSIMESYSLLSTFVNQNASGSSGDVLDWDMLK